MESALRAKTALAEKYRGKPTTLSMIIDYEQTGKRFKDTAAGQELLALARRLRGAYEKNDD